MNVISCDICNKQIAGSEYNLTTNKVVLSGVEILLKMEICDICLKEIHERITVLKI